MTNGNDGWRHVMGEGMARIKEAFRGRTLHITYDPHSPWLNVKVDPAWGEEATPENGERHFAIWNYTGDVYDVRDEMVGEDPIPVTANLREIR
jgi:hypothetical protein